MRRFALGRAGRAAFGCLAGALASGVMLASAPPALAATATLTTPASSATYGGLSIPIAYSLSNPPEDDISLVFDYTSGSNASAGDTWTVLLAGVADSGSFNMSAANPTAASQVVSVTPSNGAIGTSLPGGTYDVTLTYDEESPTFGLAIQSPTATGVVIDTTTQTPVLTTPAASTAYSSPLPVAFTLPEPALAGSATLTLSSGSVTRVVTLAGSLDTAGSHSLSLATSSLETSPGVASVLGGDTLPDGTYTVTLAYQDQYGNPQATASATAVTVDTVTLAPVLVSPTSGTYTGTLPLTYTLPEAGEAGTVSATFSGSAAARTVTLTDASAGTHTVNLDPTDLASSPGVGSVAGGSTLPYGTYVVTLSYQDSLGNPAATTTVANVVVQAATPAPPPSTASTTDGSAQPPTAAQTGASGEATLAARWRSHLRGKRGWVVKASFKPQAGAASYRFVATLGGRSKTGTCRRRGKAARARIVCTATVSHPGAWKLEASADSAAGTALAAQTRRVRLRSRHRRH